MLKKTILIDVDGVLSDFVSTYLKLYEEYADESIPHDFEWDSWEAMDRLPDRNAREHVWKDARLFLDQSPYPGSIEALERLHRGHRALIVTAIPHRHIPSRSEWFKKHAPFIHRKDQMIFTNQKHLVCGDVLIDDHVPHIDSWNAWNREGGILLNRPWNRDVGGRKYARIDSLEVFADFMGV